MATEQELQQQRLQLTATKQWKEFLESTPAYVEKHFANLLRDLTPQSTVTNWGFYTPRIQIYCETCDGERGFDCGDTKVLVPDYKTPVLYYTCRDCGTWKKLFALICVPDKKNTSTLIAIKLGEYPPFGSHLAKRLQKMLTDEDLALYRKGLRTEREGQGIGAAAYFRRVVENQWKDLVTKLRDAAAKLGTPADRLKVFDDALAQNQFSTAVEMLKDAIPPKLLILDGRNPLTLLYKPLSVQIHDLSDDECLQQAADIRTVLNELFDNIARVFRDEEELRGAVSRLLT
jgi:hypothetical protein